MAAFASNTAGRPKDGPRNAFDGLTIASSSASSSRMKPLPYDVFINHHGLDTKDTVANRIYNSLEVTGIRVFLDKNELELGDFFPTVLEEAMSSAGLHIAIFSEHYAESPWCLAELAFMVETGTTIIPIFYHVDPSTLRWAIEGKGIYAEAFSIHEMKSSKVHENKRRYSSKQLEDWKRALHKASLFTGEIINNQEDEQRVVKNVVNRVLKETKNVLKVVLLEVAKHPVGVDEAVENFGKIAADQSDGSIKIVGIWGLGGSGKTTLAKKIFNNKRSDMHRSSFLFDLRDAAGKGLLVEKQKKLLKDLGVESVSFDNVDEGKGILKSSLRSVSALIILDDVDHTDQLDALLPARESLGQGSLIVVTTRDLDVLIACGITAIYEMRPLNDTHAKQLFCWHAFLQPSPLPGFEDLVGKFLKACKGLPLSLKVVGAQLYGKSEKDYWLSLLDKLSRILPDDIKLRLKVSYDALDNEEKDMFLDAACFFIGQSRSVAIAVWDGSGWSGLYGWEKLFNKCLVEVEDGGKIRMHDHLRDLGRELANRQSPYRLWSPQQCIQIHSQREAIQIRGLVNAIDDNCYLGQGNIRIRTSLGERSVALRSLGLKVFVDNGDFINQELGEISGELVWFQCVEFKNKNLPSLKELKILKIWRTRSLENLWEHDADAPVHLRELVIEGCTSLREFPRSIGRLKNLKKIIIDPDIRSNWDTLSTLPQEFCHLQSVEHLEIRECTNLSSLPRNFGELKNLKHLNFFGCFKLKMLPDSFKKLTRLEHLNLGFCIELIIKSDLLENMTKLRYLNLNRCKKLEELRLPEVASLTNIYLKGTSLKQLPTNIFHLPKLTELVIGGEFLETLPSSPGNSSPLNKIEVMMCDKLEALSDSLQHLNCLKDLVIYGSGVKFLSISLIHLQSLKITETPISELSFGLGCMLKTISLWSTKVSKISISEDSCPFLETLSLGSNKDLRDVETLPATLKGVSAIGCNVLKDIRGVRGLKNLKSLKIESCTELVELPCFAELVSLEIFTLKGNSKVKKIAGMQELRSLKELIVELEELPSLAKFTSLIKFELQKCNKFEKIESFSCLKSLEVLKISDCPGLDVLPDLSEITSIKIIELEKCHKLEKIEGLQVLRSLETLNISDCPKLQTEGLGGLRSLKTLKISDCPELDRLPSLEELTSLGYFDLKMCQKLEKIEGLESFTSLETLYISDCPKLDSLPSLQELSSLKYFNLKMCHKLEKIEGLESLTSLKTLRIRDCPELGRFPSLEELTSLQSLKLKRCHKLDKIEGLERFRSLRSLKICNCPELDRLPSLEELTSLQSLKLKRCHELDKIEGLERLRSLRKLKICNCPELDRLPSLEELTSLRYFDLKMCHKLKKIESLGSLTSLDMLNIIDCAELDELPSLKELTYLQFFDLKMCHKLKKIEGLEGLRSLVSLNISDCPELERLPSIKELTSLRYFDLKMCHKLEKIEGLERLVNLEVHSCLNVPSIVNLEHCQRLERLVVVTNDRSDIEPYISTIQKWPTEVIICTRTAVFDVGSLKKLFELPNVSILDYPEGESDAMAELKRRKGAILICFIIDCVYPYLNINVDRGMGYFDTELAEGKWLWMGLFTQGSYWFGYDRDKFWAYSEKNRSRVKVKNESRVKVKMEEAWSVMGEEGSIVEAFRQIFQSQCNIGDHSLTGSWTEQRMT